MIPDFINGLFEIMGSYFAWKNCFILIKDKNVTGFYWPTILFFIIWGIWNLIYYPSLNQWASFCGGIVLVCGNIFWIVLYFRYKGDKK